MLAFGATARLYRADLLDDGTAVYRTILDHADTPAFTRDNIELSAFAKYTL